MSAFIADQLRRAYDGEAWHGPAVFEILADVDATIAAKRPIPDAHTIWELVLHMAAWDEVILLRLAGQVAMLESDDPDNFPLVSDTSGSAWHQALELLRRNNRKLQAEVGHIEDSRLSKQVPGKDYDIHFMLHGAVQHALYHAGQMAILKKAARPSMQDH